MIEHLVLIFAYNFPPESEIGGARPFRFSKYLSRLGYTCRVFTAAKQAGREDPNTEYVPDPFVTRSRHRLSSQLERAVRKFFLPGDEGMSWSYHAFRAARTYIQAHPGVKLTLFSTFPPLGTHLAGWQLAQNTRLAWIADCRDPLADDFTDQRRPHSQKRLYQWLERAVAQRADAVIANTDAARARWEEKFPNFRNKFHLIWNGFDMEERAKPLPLLSGECKTLSHVGDLYHGRNATPILESIARLIAANRLTAGGVRVRLIGSAQPECLPCPEFILRAKAEGWLDLVTERISRKEALQAAQTSHGLLLLQPQSATQVPGKLFEYIQIGRPILAYIHPNSPVERLLERSGALYKCVYPGTSPEKMDHSVANFFELPSTAVTPSSWFEENFNAERQARALDFIIRSLHGESPRDELLAPVSDVSAATCDDDSKENTIRGRCATSPDHTVTRNLRFGSEIGENPRRRRIV